MAETLAELVAKISADATELKKGLADAEKGTEQSSKRMSESLKKVGIAMTAAGAAITAAMGLMGKAAIDEEINIKRLATTMGNVGVSYDKVKDSLEAVIAATQRKTGVADGEQRDILNRLILVTGDYRKALELLPTVLDLAAAGEMDAATAATYLGKAYLDLESGAEEVSVRFGQASLQFKSMEDIQNRVAGSAEALVNPFNVLKASMSDVAETIGAFLIPAIKGLVDVVVNIATKIQEWAKEHPQLAEQLTFLTLGIGVVLTAIGGLILILPHLIEGYKALTIVINAATVSTWGFYASLLVIPLAAAGLSIAISELTGNTERMNAAGQTLWYQNIGNWILRQLGLTSAVETTTGVASTLNRELQNLGLAGEELTKTYKTLSEAGYLSIGTSTIEQVKEYTRCIDDAKKGTDDAVKSLQNLSLETQAIKRAMGSATWTADGYTYSMSLFTQAEIDAAKASGKKVDILRTQSDVTEDNTEKTADYIKTIDKAVISVERLAEAEKTMMAAQIAAKQAVEARTTPRPGEGYLGFEGWDPDIALLEMKKMAFYELFPFQDINKMVEEAGSLSALVGFQHGGIVTQPTMAMIGEAGPEAVIPLNEAMGGITINFTQPVFFDREDTMNKFVDMIRKGIQRQDRIRFGGAYSG